MRKIDGGECNASFGEYIKQARLRLGLGQIELAQECGITQSHLSRIESGHRSIDIALAIEFCITLKLSADEFMDKYRYLESEIEIEFETKETPVQ